MWFIGVLYSYRQRVRFTTLFPSIFSHCFCMLCGEFAKVFETKVWRVQVAHLHNAARALSSPMQVGVFNCQQILTNISVVVFDIVVKKSNRMSFSVALVKFHWFGINWHVFMQKLSFVCYYSENRATSRVWKVFPNMVFPPIRGEKWRRSEHAHASYPGLFFRSPGFSPYMRREERRVQGLDYLPSRTTSGLVSQKSRFSRSISLVVSCLYIFGLLADQLSCRSYGGNINRIRSLAASRV